MKKNKVILWVIVCTFFTSIGQILYKLGALKESSLHLIFFGLVFYGLGAVILLKALKEGELSVVYPILSLSYVWVVMFSSIILMEIISIQRAFGAIVIILGVTILGIK